MAFPIEFILALINTPIPPETIPFEEVISIASPPGLLIISASI